MKRMAKNVWFVATLVCVFSLVGADAKGAKKNVTDGQITGQVEEQLLFDPAVPYNTIDVSTQLKVVSLSGTVDNLLAKERAAKLARAVRGVKSVVNRIEVAPYKTVTPAALERNARGALIHNPATESFDVTVSADKNGKVTLTGTVDSWQERDLSAKVVSGVIGVRGIDNRLVVRMPGDRSPIEIKKEIEEKLKWDALVKEALIDVTVKGKTARLSGIVGSAAEKQRAIDDVWGVGVDEVDATGLEVSKWARDDALRTKEHISLPDPEIRVAVSTALIADPRVPSPRVSASVYRGIVTLRGVVETTDAQRAAVQDAYNTTGVRMVKNLIKVRPKGDLKDAYITRDIKSALKRNPYLEDQDISVSVDHGKAVLDGTVDTIYEKAQAEALVARTAGVSKITNKLEVDTPAYLAFNPYVGDWDFTVTTWYNDLTPTQILTKNDKLIKEEIHDELVWSPFVDADQVEVTVEDGVAFLSGKVDSWTEARAAMNNALEGGAHRVVSALTLL